MQDLHLALKHEWFVVFKEGDKPVEVRERAEAEGRQMLRNIANYGYASFLCWAVANWGTKWNSMGDDKEMRYDVHKCKHFKLCPENQDESRLFEKTPGLDEHQNL